MTVIASHELGRRPVSTSGESCCSSTIYRDVVTRKSTNPKNEMLCVFCQKDEEQIPVHEVMAERMGKRLKTIAQNSIDNLLKLRLIDILSSDDIKAGVAYDLKYHRKCLITAERIAISSQKLLEMLQAELNFSESNIMDMNTVNAAYINILKENKVEGVQNDYKKNLKSLISENIKDIHFNRPSDRTKPTQILSAKTKVQILSEVVKLNSHDQSSDIKILLQAAKIIRNDISKNSNWEFTGSFDDYGPPPLTYFLCKHVIQGNSMIGTEQRGKDLERSSPLLTQTVIQSYKSDRRQLPFH